MTLKWPKRIVFVRHAESMGNVTSREDQYLHGRANHTFTLTEEGTRQAQSTGEWLKARYEFDATLCSTYSRTQDTLKCMFLNASPIIDSRLNELWRGIWHTMPASLIKKEFPYEEKIRDREGLFHYSAPGGHSGADLELRVYSFLQQLRMDFSGKSVLVVTHGYWMLHLWRILKNKTIAEYEQRYVGNKYRNCAICICEVLDDKLKFTLDGFVAYDNPMLSK